MTQDVPKAREMIREGLSKITEGKAMIQHAVDHLMWKGKGEEPKSNGKPQASTNKKDRTYVSSDDIPPMFEYLKKEVEDTEEIKTLRSLRGDWRFYKHLTSGQYNLLKKFYLSYDGPDL